MLRAAGVLKGDNRRLEDTVADCGATQAPAEGVSPAGAAGRQVCPCNVTQAIIGRRRIEFVQIRLACASE